MSIVAVVPAKARSRRCPAKNFRPLHGRPLWQWTVEAALEAGVEKVIISTDQPDGGMRAMALAYDQIELLERSLDLCEDGVEATDVVLDATSMMIAERVTGVMMLLPTSPFRSAEDIELVVGRWRELGELSTVVTVTSAPHLSRKLKRVSASSGQLVGPPMADWVVSNGAVQLTSWANFHLTPVGFWAPGPVYGVRLDHRAGLDIDTEEDWALALHLAGVEHDRAP